MSQATALGAGMCAAHSFMSTRPKALFLPCQAALSPAKNLGDIEASVIFKAKYVLSDAMESGSTSDAMMRDGSDRDASQWSRSKTGIWTAVVRCLAV